MKKPKPEYILSLCECCNYIEEKYGIDNCYDRVSDNLEDFFNGQEICFLPIEYEYWHEQELMEKISKIFKEEWPECTDKVEDDSEEAIMIYEFR